MNRYFRSKAAFLLILSFIFIFTPSAFTAEETQSSITVDFASGSVGGVIIRGTINDIRKAVGASRINKTIEYPEGQQQDMYIVYFGNHKIFKHCNPFSYTDPAFKTKEGLGIGSKVKDFNKFYGEGQVREAEGFAIYYKTENGQISVIPKEQDMNLYANSTVIEIWVW